MEYGNLAAVLKGAFAFVQLKKDAKGNSVLLDQANRPVSLNRAARGSLTAAKNYRNLQAALRPQQLVKPTSGLIHWDPNRGSDINDGLTKSQSVSSPGKVLQLLSLSPVGSEVVAIAADADIRLTSIGGVPGRIFLPGSGTSSSARRWITSYDPTGYFPTQKPRISYNIKPLASHWTNESGNLWYIKNSDFSGGTRNFGDNVLVIFGIASSERKFGKWVFHKTSLNEDKRYWADDGNKRLYVYSIGNPTDYYEGILVAEGQSGVFGLGTDGNGVSSSNWMIDGIQPYDCSALLTLTQTTNYEGMSVQNCVSEYLSNLVSMVGNANATLSKASFTNNRGVKFGGAALNIGPGLYDSDILFNDFDDGNYSKSVGGAVYINSHTAMAAGKYQGANRILKNYLAGFMAGTSPDSLVDGAAIYIEQRSGGNPTNPYLLPNLIAQNIIERCENAIQDNSGMVNIYESNLANDCARYMLATDANDFKHGGPIIRGGTFKGNGKVSEASLIGFGSDAVIHAWMPNAKSLVVNDMVVDAPNTTFIRASNGTLDLRNNTIPKGMHFTHNLLPDAPGTVRYDPGYLLEDYFAPPGDVVGVPDGRPDLLGAPVSPGSLRGAIT